MKKIIIILSVFLHINLMASESDDISILEVKGQQAKNIYVKSDAPVVIINKKLELGSYTVSKVIYEVKEVNEYTTCYSRKPKKQFSDDFLGTLANGSINMDSYFVVDYFCEVKITIDQY
jgi:hypothetical protein